MDREKVIRGLECCLPMTTRNGLADCKQCPYDRKITLEGGVTECCHDLMADALALLKAQEPIDAIPMDWLDAQIHGYASRLQSTELKALIVVKGLWEMEQEAR